MRVVAPHPVATPYLIGTGIGDVTDPAVGLVMQGMADPTQVTGGVESRLLARAFVVEERDNQRRVAILISDIWGVSRHLKNQVVSELAQALGGYYYTDENLHFAATHHHSGPGGYMGWKLYDYQAGGFDGHTTACIVGGCVDAVKTAHTNRGPGRIYVKVGSVEGCGQNVRSRRTTPTSTAASGRRRPTRRCSCSSSQGSIPRRVMSGLRECSTGTRSIRPIAARRTQVCGDNKGYAAAQFEKQMGRPERFVAAFANSNCGDVSPNVELGHIPDGVNDKAQMEKHGGLQFQAASRPSRRRRSRLAGQSTTGTRTLTSRTSR